MPVRNAFFRGRPCLATLLPMLALVFAGAAHAGAVTAPSGGTQSATAPLVVKWNGIGIANGVAAPVGIELTAVSPTGGLVTVPLAPSVANTGLHVIAPASYRNLVCGMLPTVMAQSLTSLHVVTAPVPIGQMTFHVVVRNVATPSDFAKSPGFKIKCPPKLDTMTLSREVIGRARTRADTQGAGWARVQKIVVNATGAPVALPTSFSIGGMCSGGASGMGPSGLTLVGLTVVAGAGKWQSFGANYESSCAAFEIPPDSIPGLRACGGRNASWTVNVSPAQVSYGSGSTDITVTNTLSCDRAPPVGSLVIVKEVVSDAGMPPPDINFYIDVACKPSGLATTVKLNRENGYREIIDGIAIDSACTVNEQAPELSLELARRGCHWETSYPDGQRVPIGGGEPAILRVVNRWVCKKSA